MTNVTSFLYKLRLIRVTLVVAFGFLFPNFGKWQGPKILWMQVEVWWPSEMMGTVKHRSCILQWRIQEGRPQRAPPPTGQIFLNFMQSFRKICMLAPSHGGLAPLLRGILDSPLYSLLWTVKWVVRRIEGGWYLHPLHPISALYACLHPSCSFLPFVPSFACPHQRV